MNKLEQIFWSIDNRTYNSILFGWWLVSETFRDWQLIIFNNSKVAQIHFWNDLSGGGW